MSAKCITFLYIERPYWKVSVLTNTYKHIVNNRL